MIRGGNCETRIWPGAVWRPPPGKRGAALHAALVARPGCCVRRLGGNRAQEMRFRRFLHNGSVTRQEMACEAVTGTAARVAGRDIVVAQDTSELTLGGRRARANGFGPVGKGGALGGLLLHAALALDAASGALLGLADAKIWNRDKGKLKHRRSRATADKELQRWLDTTMRVGEVLASARSITCVSDRESDIYEHFLARPSNVHLIVRACQDRLIDAAATDTSALLFGFIDSIAGTRPLQRGNPRGAWTQGACCRVGGALHAGGIAQTGARSARFACNGERNRRRRARGLGARGRQRARSLAPPHHTWREQCRRGSPRGRSLPPALERSKNTSARSRRRGSTLKMPI